MKQGNLLDFFARHGFLESYLLEIQFIFF
jgi:hypothetical protein